MPLSRLTCTLVFICVCNESGCVSAFTISSSARMCVFVCFCVFATPLSTWQYLNACMYAQV